MSQLIKNVTIGADVEVFLQDKNTNEIVSAEGIIKGKKTKPYVFDPKNKYFATSLDNVLAEFCIPPATHVDEWVNNLMKSVNFIKSTIPQELDVKIIPAANLHERFLKTKNAQEFGCEPDYNAWTRSVNEKPSANDATLRSAGGHIHVGYENPSVELSEQIIRTMDLFLGVPSVIQEVENKRKELYGKAGAFRFKDYGCEYRTISNYYLENDATMRWAFVATQRAIDFINAGKYPMVEERGDAIVSAINDNNKSLADHLIREFDLVLA